MYTGNWNDFVGGVSARVNEIIDETKDLAPSWKSLPFYKEVQADGDFGTNGSLIYRTQGVVGFGYDELFDEGDALKYDRTYPAYQTEYVIKQRGKGVTISQLLMKTRSSLLEAKLDEVRQLRISANRSMEKNFWAIFNDAFGTTNGSANFPTYRLADAVALISASHPSLVPGVAVRSNLISGTGSGTYSGINPVLNETSLFEAIKQLREMLNGRGMPINYTGKVMLVVPTALEKLAQEITKSSLRSDTANNDTNYYNGMVDVVASTYLGAANGGSDTRWFVSALPSAAENATAIRYVKLIEPKIEKEVDFDTKTMKISNDYAGAFGYSNFEYLTGSTGLQA
jgi:hypothetical protein